MAKKKTDGPTPPKKPLTGFFLYKADVYDDVKKEFPEKKMTELTQVISKRWALVDAAKKQDYDKKHAVLKTKYEKEKAEFEETYGKPEKKKRKSKKKGSEDDEDDDDDDEKPAKRSRGSKKK